MELRINKVGKTKARGGVASRLTEIIQSLFLLGQGTFLMLHCSARLVCSSDCATWESRLLFQRGDLSTHPECLLRNTQNILLSTCYRYLALCLLKMKGNREWIFHPHDRGLVYHRAVFLFWT